MTDTNAPASGAALNENGHGEHDDAAAEVVMPPLNAGIDEERAYVGALYRRLDQLREEARTQLAKVRSSGAVGTMQNMSERDAFATMYEDRLAQLNAVDDRLVFGRLDLETDESRYIGRIALSTESRQRLMLDWRAPEAGVFYQATAFDRQGVRRRRHLLLKRRSVQGIEDEVLDPAMLEEGTENHGDGALLAAVTARRTGQMGDIVATIQAEQDRIIRADRSGILVVQGGPGTGKTAVALHRAAYLLYTHRERLKSAGVLIVGPSSTFMSYIERVLPSLGETGVVMSSLADLYPGVRGVEESDQALAEIKGRLDWVQIIADAVAHRRRTIAEARHIVVDGVKVKVTPKMINRGIERAKATGKPYNEARATFVKVMVKEIADTLEDILANRSQGNEADRSYLVEDVRNAAQVRVLLNLCWLPRTPQALLEDLYAKPEYLAAVAPQLEDSERQLLRREPGAAFTTADVPLLDEAAELLGELDETAGREEARQQAARQKDLENAQKAVENAGPQLEEMGIEGFLDAEAVAALNAETGHTMTAAERAGVDRTWTYGHVVVDEAQELTPMQWHILMRRCPLKSFTAVGDTAQGSSPSATTSWKQAFAPFIDDRLRVEELTVNYRTPRNIVELAERVAEANGLQTTQLRTVREGDYEPIIETHHQAEHLVAAATAAVAAERQRLAEGLIAVIAPEPLVGSIRESLVEVYGRRVGQGAGSMTQDVVALSAAEAKGLEFDGVVLIEPAELLDEAAGKVGSLYVALTRSTQSLRVLAARDLPAGF
ncbi:AAA family ATPase [Garicola koreensis]|uniref:DNA helicase IV n=2 Tax=Garicola koreensis TaxID=1262554 RepID=A0A7W5XNI9_9MICC|nr:DNA helicase IV [Garicola koreensis]